MAVFFSRRRNQLVEDAALGVEELDGVLFPPGLLLQRLLHLVARLAGLLDLLLDGLLEILLGLGGPLIGKGLVVTEHGVSSCGCVGRRIQLVGVLYLLAGALLFFFLAHRALLFLLGLDRLVHLG